MLRLRTSKAQSTAEYAVVVAIVLGAIIGMQTFVKRTLQARYKVATVNLTKITPATSGITLPAGFPAMPTYEQYEPYYAHGTTSTSRADNFNEKYEEGKVTRSGVLSKVTRTGDQGESGSGALASDNEWR